MAQASIYDRYSRYYRLLTSLEHYIPEAKAYLSVLGKVQKGRNLTALELGCGAGHNAYYMKKRYRFTLTDLSPAMLRLSRQINPDCRHIRADMRKLRLKEKFDLVFVHDAVMFMKIPKALRRAIQTAAVHLKPGGYAFFLPDATTETFKEGIECDGEGALRYIEWKWLPRGKRNVMRVSYQFLVRKPNGGVLSWHEVDDQGLFSRKFWTAELKKAGLSPKRLPDRWGRDLFLARKK